jgi:hypothetical protein
MSSRAARRIAAMTNAAALKVNSISQEPLAGTA